MRITSFLLGTSLLLCVLNTYQLPRRVNPADKVLINEWLKQNGLDAPPKFSGFESEIKFIRSVQQSIQKMRDLERGIPQYQERNFSDYYKLRQGLCYDLSHVIEMILRCNGFKTRHVFVFFDCKSFWQLLFTKKSHALSEVRTSKGWILVDSLSPFAEKVRLRTQTNILFPNTSHIFNHRNAHLVRGLYSRHGKFYSPYTVIPDYVVGDIFSNLTIMLNECH